MNDILFDMKQLERWRQGDGDNSERLRRLRRRLPEAMAELTPKQQLVVKLQYEDELSVTDIARRLGVNKSSVSRCLRRARHRLYSRLRFTL